MRHYYSLVPAAAVRPGFDGHSYVNIPHDMDQARGVVIENFDKPRMMRWTSDCFIRAGVACVLFAKRGDALPVPTHLPFGVSVEHVEDEPFMAQLDVAYKVSYTYDNPSSAGPFKGSMTTPKKHAKGDSIAAPFGSATVVSCRKVPHV